MYGSLVTRLQDGSKQVLRWSLQACLAGRSFVIPSSKAFKAIVAINQCTAASNALPQSRGPYDISGHVQASLVWCRTRFKCRGSLITCIHTFLQHCVGCYWCRPRTRIRTRTSWIPTVGSMGCMSMLRRMHAKYVIHAYVYSMYYIPSSSTVLAATGTVTAPSTSTQPSRTRTSTAGSRGGLRVGALTRCTQLPARGTGSRRWWDSFCACASMAGRLCQ